MTDQHRVQPAFVPLGAINNGGMIFIAFIIGGLLLFVVLAPIVLSIIIPVHKEHERATGHVVNYDPTMRKFVYKVYLSKEDILTALNTPHIADELTCLLDREQSTVVFSEYGSHIEYWFAIQESEGFSIISLHQIPFITMGSYIPLKLNPFMVQKLKAEIVPFSQYGNWSKPEHR